MRAVQPVRAGGHRGPGGPVLEVRDTAPIQEELLAEAVAAARRKAERLAAAAERELGRALTVAEGGDDVPVPRFHSGVSAFAEGPALEPADTVVAASVVVTFALA